MSPALRSVVSALLLALLGTTAGPLGAPASYADGAGVADSQRTTVGIQTSGRNAPDDRDFYRYTAAPKGVIQDFVAVANYSLHPVTVRLMAKDATSTPDAPFTVQPSDQAPTELGSWIGLRATELTIGARSRKIVPFQLGVPYNASPGDHAGAIMVSLLSEEPKPGSGKVVVDNRVGLRIYLRVPGKTTPRLEISDLHASWNGAKHLTGRGGVTVSYTVRNTGNIRLAADQQVVLSGPGGVERQVAVPESIKEILPGGSVAVTQTVPRSFGLGRLHAVVTLHPHLVDTTAGEKLPDVTADVWFGAWPALLVIASLLLLLFLIVLGTWYRGRRKGRRLSVISGGKEDTPEPAGALVRSVLGGTLVAACVALFSAAGTGPAQAAERAPVWQATIQPKVGLANSPVEVTTTGGCPAPATNAIGFIYGAGFPEEGGIAIGNGDAGVRSDGPFTLPLASSLATLMAMQDHPTDLHGTYKIEVSCIDAGSPYLSLGRFVVAVAFDKLGLWHVQPPLTRAQGINLGTAPQPGTSEENGGANAMPPSGSATPGQSPGQRPGAGSSAGAGPGGPGGPASPDASGTAGDQPSADATAPAAASSGPGALSWVLWAAGGVVLLGAVTFLVGSRSDSTT
jgi:hypothetical protein